MKVGVCSPDRAAPGAQAEQWREGRRVRKWSWEENRGFAIIHPSAERRGAERGGQKPRSLQGTFVGGSRRASSPWERVVLPWCPPSELGCAGKPPLGAQARPL